MQKAQQQYQVNRLCSSGGVGLNCSMNGKIEQSRIFDEIFVQPASGDAGVAAGACYLGHKAYQSSYRPVKMHNFLIRIGTTIGHHTIPRLGHAKFSRDNAYRTHIGSQLSIASPPREIINRIVGHFWDYQYMYRRQLGDIVKSQHIIIFVNLIGRNLPSNYPRKNIFGIISHGLYSYYIRLNCQRETGSFINLFLPSWHPTPKLLHDE